ncbi:MAG: class I SAM-dependent methyltransferase [Actinomycetota bacterium]|nr:class I SAM-dependent methyltransferase [Actinomycetota bacterium]
MNHAGIPGFLKHQSHSTAQLRRHLYRKAGIGRRRAILDIGCGTGEITAEIASLSQGRVTGVDGNNEFIELARKSFPEIEFFVSDISSLPFNDNEFDLLTSHFVFMWLKEPLQVLSEIRRVLEPGGLLLISAEPDYGGRVEFPENPDFSFALEESLKRQGADSRIGRKLGFLLRKSGFSVEWGVSSTILEEKNLEEELESNLEVYLDDLSVFPEIGAKNLLDKEKAQVSSGKMLIVPIFWALGTKTSYQ